MSHAWNAVDKAVGLKVKLTTVDGGEVEGARKSDRIMLD